MTNHTATSHPSRSGAPSAALVTADPLLALELTRTFAGIRAGLLTRLPGAHETHLRETDALLLIPPPGGTGPTRTVYIGTDLDDQTVWARAAALHAVRAVFLPDARTREQISGWLTGDGDPGDLGDEP